jgi:hypothetical protein
MKPPLQALPLEQQSEKLKSMKRLFGVSMRRLTAE